MQPCNKCGIAQEDDQFPKHLHGQCRSCRRAYNRNRYATVPGVKGRARAYHIKYNKSHFNRNREVYSAYNFVKRRGLPAHYDEATVKLAQAIKDLQVQHGNLWREHLDPSLLQQTEPTIDPVTGEVTSEVDS